MCIYICILTGFRQHNFRFCELNESQTIFSRALVNEIVSFCGMRACFVYRCLRMSKFVHTQEFFMYGMYITVYSRVQNICNLREYNLNSKLNKKKCISSFLLLIFQTVFAKILVLISCPAIFMRYCFKLNFLIIFKVVLSYALCPVQALSAQKVLS